MLWCLSILHKLFGVFLPIFSVSLVILWVCRKGTGPNWPPEWEEHCLFMVRLQGVCVRGAAWEKRRDGRWSQNWWGRSSVRKLGHLGMNPSSAPNGCDKSINSCGSVSLSIKYASDTGRLLGSLIYWSLQIDYGLLEVSLGFLQPPSHDAHRRVWHIILSVGMNLAASNRNPLTVKHTGVSFLLCKKTRAVLGLLKCLMRHCFSFLFFSIFSVRLLRT